MGGRGGREEDAALAATRAGEQQAEGERDRRESDGRGKKGEAGRETAKPNVKMKKSRKREKKKRKETEKKKESRTGNSETKRENEKKSKKSKNEAERNRKEKRKKELFPLFSPFVSGTHHSKKVSSRAYMYIISWSVEPIIRLALKLVNDQERTSYSWLPTGQLTSS